MVRTISINSIFYVKLGNFWWPIISVGWPILSANNIGRFCRYYRPIYRYRSYTTFTRKFLVWGKLDWRLRVLKSASKVNWELTIITTSSSKHFRRASALQIFSNRVKSSINLNSNLSVITLSFFWQIATTYVTQTAEYARNAMEALGTNNHQSWRVIFPCIVKIYYIGVIIAFY